ncbi:sulfhydrogenase 1 subunit delta [Coprothermobacteraceae bacterium]|nr:sulfhydrogenase 1 subunit delta [Coprothermobacteraceae bacterium]
MERRKLKVGIWALTGCYGCQLNFVNLEDDLLKIVQNVDLEVFYMATRANNEETNFDVSFIEGSVTTPEDEEEAKKARERSKYVVALGNCAVNGGVQGFNSTQDFETNIRTVYGDDAHFHLPFGLSKPLDSVIKVDFYLYGCPPEKKDYIYFLTTLLLGTWPEDWTIPVCAECRLKGNPCVIIERGEPCVGPITVAGCEARCPSHNVACIGCRGPLKVVDNSDAMALTFKGKELPTDRILDRMRLFSAYKDLSKVEEALRNV